MTTEGQHLLMDIWYDQEVEPIVDQLCNLVNENFKVVGSAAHTFEPQGRTIVYILSESHFTVHTYPEHKYISLDVYICNPAYDLAGFAEKVINLASPIDYNAALDKRGIRGEA